ncbi:XRE family transcriptional regulator [Klebsiella pneumoniae]|nr:XRE family transcriptional regulator [Klebsiella pneumoniae]
MTKKVNLMTDANAIVNTVNEAVSQRIKQYRKQKKISLDELSRRAGVSKGALVEIEGCRANPSIALLCRLATAMGFRWLILWMSVPNRLCISLLKMRSQNCGKVKKAGEQDCSQGRVGLI